MLVQLDGDQFLARARLALDVHVHVEGRHAQQGLEQAR
jgi:hypothetical protein